MAGISPTAHQGVFSDGRRFLTANLTPGRKVYEEDLVSRGGVEYRAWSPRRSKLCALLHKSPGPLPLTGASRVLYLGAANGTTASHVSDIAVEGSVHCVEVSRRAFRDLLELCDIRRNMIPYLADAARPGTYSRLVGPVDLLYQDISQRDQAGIFLKNADLLVGGGHGILMVKARSVDVNADPKRVYRQVREELTASGLRVVEWYALDPYEKDHAAILVEKTC